MHSVPETWERRKQRPQATLSDEQLIFQNSGLQSLNTADRSQLCYGISGKMRFEAGDPTLSINDSRVAGSYGIHFGHQSFTWNKDGMIQQCHTAMGNEDANATGHIQDYRRSPGGNTVVEHETQETNGKKSYFIDVMSNKKSPAQNICSQQWIWGAHRRYIKIWAPHQYDDFSVFRHT